MGGEENEQIGVGEDWVSFDVEKEYGGEEDEVLWPHRPEERYGENIDARDGVRQAEKGQTSNGLDPGFDRMNQAGHCCCITTGDRSGKMARNHRAHFFNPKYAHKKAGHFKRDFTPESGNVDTYSCMMMMMMIYDDYDDMTTTTTTPPLTMTTTTMMTMVKRHTQKGVQL